MPTKIFIFVFTIVQIGCSYVNANSRTTAPTTPEIRRYYHAGKTSTAYGTFFRLWGGWASAAHVYMEMNKTSPPFVSQSPKVLYANGLDQFLNLKKIPSAIDGICFGCNLPLRRPTEPLRDRKVVVMGFPEGSNSLAQREATVYTERERGVWIAKIESPLEPVVTGMSGGPVLDYQTGETIGILLSRNSRADLNRDGILDESFDFFALSRFWDLLNGR